MRKVEKFVKILLMTAMVITVLLFADVCVLVLMAAQTDKGITALPLEQISEQLERTVGENAQVHYSLSAEGRDIVDRFEGFAFLMDDLGNVVWSYHLPDELPLRYTVRQIVQFARFYLKDYPVFTRIVEDGVLVVGLPRQSVWKYQFSFRIETVELLLRILPLLFLANVVLALIVPVVLIRHDAHRREMQRTSWIAGVSHDIRTPLALVIGYADELAHLRADAMEAEAVTVRAQRIEQQAIRIRTLVTNLNTSNKLAYGMGVWHREKVLLPAVLRASICEVLNRDFDEKYDIDVCIEESLESLYVSGDKELIKRLIENLMNNAISHNPQGCTIKISLTQKRRCLLHKTVLEVSDNGCGVSRRQLRAFRLARHSDRLPEHGLGVRLVWQIASFHHWQVSFCNNPESGFSCKLYIK